MTMQAFDNPFIADAVWQVILHPEASHLWHLLMARYQEWPGAAEREFIMQAIGSQVAPDGLAGFHRATMLAGLTGAGGHAGLAAQLAMELRPLDANRLMAYANLQWGLALRDAASHHEFQAMLQQVRLPDMMRQLGLELEGRATPVPAAPAAPPGAPRKVALLAPHLGTARHPPTQMALRQLTLLAGRGLETVLFACQEFDIAAADHYLGCGRRTTVPALDQAWLAQSLPSGASASVADARLSLMRRWQDTLARIEAWGPDLVLFVGLFSPLMFALYQRYPVLGLSVHAVPPMAPVDVWLSADPALRGSSASLWGPALPPALAHYHPYRVEARPAAPAARAGLGLQDGQLLLVTVGARLEREVGGAWAARMLALLEQEPALAWLLVGGDGMLPPALAGAPAGRIRCIAHTSEVASILAACDIYLNPPRVGGGLSAGEAMAQGVPVLALAGGDAGAKLGAAALADDDAYFSHLLELIGNPELRRRCGEQQQRHFHASLDVGQSAVSLLQACALAMQRHGERSVSSPAAS